MEAAAEPGTRNPEPGRGSGSRCWKRTGRAKTGKEEPQTLAAGDLFTSVVGEERRKKEEEGHNVRGLSRRPRLLEAQASLSVNKWVLHFICSESSAFCLSGPPRV